MRKGMKAGFLALLALILVLTVAIGCSKRIDGEYDYDYNFVSEVGSDPASLTERVRTVEMQIFNFSGSHVGSQIAVGYIYSEEYVIVPAKIFYLTVGPGPQMPVWQVKEEITNISFKLFLLADPEKEDEWKTEELGQVLNKRDIKEGKADFAIVERIDPLIEIPENQYTIGKYEDLKVGNVLYRTSKDNKNHMTVLQSDVIGLRVDGERNLVDFQGGALFYYDLGGLLFAVRDGKFEVVGMVCVIEPIPMVSGVVYFLALDLGQIIDYLKGETGKEEKK